MKVVSLNIGQPTEVFWRGQSVHTGIYKYPVEGPITLEKEDVDGDAVVDRRFHGGIDKACYLFSADFYDYWKTKYPDLEWQWGMFGENITVEGLNEDTLCIGDILQIGTAVVQVSQPRQPCFKLGIRFNNQQILKDFIAFAYPGIYLRVLEPGDVTNGDSLKIIERDPAGLSIREVFRMIYDADERKKINEAITHPFLAESCKLGLEDIKLRHSL